MSAVLSPWFSVVLLLICGSSEGLNITKKTGEDVTLPCRTEKKYSLIVLEWTRDGLGTKNVFVLRDGRPFPASQHESFRNRVSLNVSQMKDGDLSVVLKNVRIDDSGTYKCGVIHENDPQRELNLISSVHLSVDPSPGDPSPGQQGGLEGDQGGKKEDGGTKKEGLSPGVIIGFVLPVLVVVAVGIWIYRKKKGSNQSSSGSNNQQKIEVNPLNTDSKAKKRTTNTKTKKNPF